MDNVIGTNMIGAVLETDLAEQQTIEDPVAQALLQEQLLLGAFYRPETGLGAARGPARPPTGPARPPSGGAKGAVPKSSKAAPPSRGALKKQADARKKQSPYARGLENVKGAADFAKKVGTKVVAKGAAYRPSEHKPLAIVTSKGIHGVLGVVHDSVFGVAPKKLSPKQHAAVAAHGSAITRTRAAATESIKAGNRALAAGKAADAAAKRAKPVFDKLSGKRVGGVHGILGWEYPFVGEAELSDNELHAILGWDYPLVGADDFVPDPTLYDPAHWGLPPLQPLFTGLDGDNPDPNLTPLPTGGGTLSKDDAKVAWQQVPPDSIVVDESTIPPMTVMSYGLAYEAGGASDNGNRKYGFVRGGNAGDPNAPGQDSTSWIWVHGKRGDSGSIPDFAGQERGVSGWWDNAGQINSAYNTTAGVAQASVAKGYGPLVGTGAFTGLQYAIADQKWFILTANAPPSLLGQFNAVLSDINAQTLATDNAAIDASNAAIMQQVSALAEAKIKQDADNALRASQDVADEARAASQATQTQIAAQEQEREAQARLDQQAQQQQLDEQARISQLEADMLRAQQQQAAQQAQAEQQMALAQQQLEAQLVPMQMQHEMQMAQAQAQSDAQAQQAMLQMLMQQQQYDPALVYPPQPQYDPLQAYAPQPQYDPSQAYAPQPQPQPQYDPALAYLPQPQDFDPSQLPGYFDASMYYGE